MADRNRNKKLINGVLSHKLIEEYVLVTYLNKFEIIELFKQFCNVTPQEELHLQRNFQHRVDFELLMESFPILKYNPFTDRICAVFSSGHDAKFSFEDLLDFFSVLSSNCPHHVKALWAFRMFDFDGDDRIGDNDLIMVIDRLVSGYGNRYNRKLSEDNKRQIAHKLLNALDLENEGSISEMAFQHGIGKMADFPAVFSVKI